ncbi:MAG: MATE family efflux transporter, partial [Lachnospiraceae bacterium]
MKKYIGTKEFYKMVLLVAVPIMIQNGITNFVGMLDNIMVGQVGTNEMSGVAIINQMMLVFNISIFGAVSGAGIFGAQYYGCKDYEGVRYAFRYKLVACLLVVGGAVALFLTKGDALIGLYLSDTSDAADCVQTLVCAREYLFIMLLGLLPFALEQAYSATLRETG